LATKTLPAKIWQRRIQSTAPAASISTGNGTTGRWAEGRNEQLPELAADLVRRHVAVIAAVGGNNSAFAAKAATTTIPIVFTSAADPVKVGLVISINRPGGNVTGVSWFAGELGPKRLGLLHELVPNIMVTALVVNPNSPDLRSQSEHAQEAARALGWELHVINARSEREIDAAFDTAVLQRAGAVIVSADPFFLSRRTNSWRWRPISCADDLR
jgi:putative ABC transport system substrate-binding protein